MKPAAKLPEWVQIHGIRNTVTDDETDVRVKFDYFPGEDQWFDARQGVGSPGYPASVEITEVSVEGGKWEPVENYPHLDLVACEEAVMEHIQALEEAYWEAYAEAEDARRKETL